MHPSECEWDVSEYAEPDGSLSLQNLFRLPDFETVIIGYIFKVKATTMVCLFSLCLIN